MLLNFRIGNNNILLSFEEYNSQMQSGDVAYA